MPTDPSSGLRVAAVGTALTLVICTAAPLLRAQSTPSPRFEVVSVRLSPDAVALSKAGVVPHTARTMTDTRVDLSNIPLPFLIAMAYRIKPEQVEGPGWMPDVHLDLQANLPSGAKKEQVPDMLQAVLADRLGLKAHLQSVDKPVYALVVVSGGAKLKPAEAPDPNFDGGNRIVHGIAYGSGDFGPFRFTITDGAVHYDFSSMTMSNLAALLGQNKQQTVLDETAIEGAFQIHIDVPWARIRISTPRSFPMRRRQFPPI